MPESVGNEANYRGSDIPKIELGINLVAKQDTIEKDSFNETYDENAEYAMSVNTPEKLYSALAANQNVILTEDIDLSNTDWTRVANFSGTLDGNDHKITGLSGTSGLFTSIRNGTVKNLTIEDASINTTGAPTGILANRITGTVLVENVKVSGTLTSTSMYSGGLAGAITGADSVTIKDCVNNAAITGAGDQVGGLVGCAYENIVFENCINNGNVTETSGFGAGAGGIVGFVTTYEDDPVAPTFINCTNNGTITSTNRAGGIVGSVGFEGGQESFAFTVTFDGCSNTGKIEGTTTGQIYGTKLSYWGHTTDCIKIEIK
jgi:hypothetical protein